MQFFVSFGNNSYVDKTITLPLLFKAREIVLPRKINRRIKIFALDDQSYGYLKGDDISLVDWAKIFQEIAKIPNVTVVIDKLFAKYYEEKEINRFRKIMDSAPINIAIISYTYPEKIPFREPIPTVLLEKNTSHFIAPQTNQHQEENDYQVAYGATSKILEKFSRIGHAEYSETGKIKALKTVNSYHYLPFVGLTVAKSIRINDDKVFVDNKNIHLNSNGEFVINYAPKSAFKKISYSFMTVVARVNKGLDLNIIQPGDVVVILPAMYTGNTDFKATPLGTMPGGLIVTSVIDSVLTNYWLSHRVDPGFVLSLLVISIFFVALSFKPHQALLLTLSLSLLIVMISLIAFIFFGTIIPFIFHFGAILLGGFSAIGISASANDIEDRRIKREVEVATLVQKSFLRDGVYYLGDSICVEGNSEPASECGGDWWGTFHKYGYSYIIIGDAVGHGLPAALVTAVAFGVTQLINEDLGVSMAPSIDPASILNRVNKILLAMANDAAFMTFQVLRINDMTGECLYANAGNAHPILIPATLSDSRLTAKQRTKVLIASGEPLGSSPEIDYQNHKISLHEGDQILMYTDGLVENFAERPDAPAGRIWLRRVLSGLAENSTEGHHDQIWQEYCKRIGQVPPDDDTTLITIRRRIPVQNQLTEKIDDL